jgi:hypothetical protein
MIKAYWIPQVKLGDIPLTVLRKQFFEEHTFNLSIALHLDDDERDVYKTMCFSKKELERLWLNDVVYVLN